MTLEELSFILLFALVADALMGDPDWLWARAPHPVVIMGRGITAIDRRFNTSRRSDQARRILGVAACLVFLTSAAVAGWLLQAIAALHPFAVIIEIAAVTVLLAQRSLYDHVDQVYRAFQQGGLDDARRAVARIVGRDPDSLDEAAVCRAAIESTAENFSDGVVAPAFWYLVGGLPALIAYKMINTADSMIGYRTPQHEDFGWAVARLDDVMNIIPARISGVLLAISAPSVGGSPRSASGTMWTEAGQHRSPNAGWPESAMAAALGIALAGPRTYGTTVVDDAWMNKEGRGNARPNDIRRALTLLIVACVLHAAAVALLHGCSLMV